MEELKIKLLEESDIPVVVKSFFENNWPKPRDTFDLYLEEQKEGKRCIWLAYWEGNFAGYVTLKWESFYEPFRESEIPEIMDLNVLPSFRRKAIGSMLLQLAESLAATRSSIVGLGVGLYGDYGSAQRLYISRGYVPDGLGITYNYERVLPGEATLLDDDLVLWFTKKISRQVTFPFKGIDLTHTLFPGVPIWGGFPGFERTIAMDYEAFSTDVKFRVERIEMDSGTGTHMDAPSHAVQGGITIDKVPLSQLVAPCVVIDVSDRAHERYKISVEDIEAFERVYGEIRTSNFVIFRTGWDKFWDTPEKYRNNLLFPALSKEAALYLLKKNVVGIGIDTLSPDSGDGDFFVHKAFLSSGKYIVENIANADLLAPIGCYSVCLPIKIQDGSEAPVRMIALV